MSLPFYVSPEQLMQDRAEYAKKGIAKGRSIMAIEYQDGVLFVADNPSRSLCKISEIYDTIAFSGAGQYSEFEQLRTAGIRHADLKGFLYSREDVTARALANAYSQTLGTIFSQDLKPFEVEILLAQIGNGSRETELYRIAFDGSICHEQQCVAIGGRAEALVAARRSQGGGSMPDLQAALLHGMKALDTATNQNVSLEGLEVAVLDRTRVGRRKFRRVAFEEARALLS